MPGGNPGCGDVVTIHLKADREGRAVTGLSFQGEGCTLSQAAASILMDLVLRQHRTLDQVEAMTSEHMTEILGKDLVASRPRCATLALGTLKAAVKKLRWDRRLAAARGDADVPEPLLEDAGLVFGERAWEAAAADGGARPPDPLAGPRRHARVDPDTGTA